MWTETPVSSSLMPPGNFWWRQLKPWESFPPFFLQVEHQIHEICSQWMPRIGSAISRLWSSLILDLSRVIRTVCCHHSWSDSTGELMPRKHYTNTAPSQALRATDCVGRNIYSGPLNKGAMNFFLTSSWNNSKTFALYEKRKDSRQGDISVFNRYWGFQNCRSLLWSLVLHQNALNGILVAKFHQFHRNRRDKQPLSFTFWLRKRENINCRIISAFMASNQKRVPLFPALLFVICVKWKHSIQVRLTDLCSILWETKYESVHTVCAQQGVTYSLSEHTIHGLIAPFCWTKIWSAAAKHTWTCQFSIIPHFLINKRKSGMSFTRFINRTKRKIPIKQHFNNSNFKELRSSRNWEAGNLAIHTCTRTTQFSMFFQFCLHMRHQITSDIQSADTGKRHRMTSWIHFAWPKHKTQHPSGSQPWNYKALMRNILP